MIGSRSTTPRRSSTAFSASSFQRLYGVTGCTGCARRRGDRSRAQTVRGGREREASAGTPAGDRGVVELHRDPWFWRRYAESSRTRAGEPAPPGERPRRNRPAAAAGRRARDRPAPTERRGGASPPIAARRPARGCRRRPRHCARTAWPLRSSRGPPRAHAAGGSGDEHFTAEQLNRATFGRARPVWPAPAPARPSPCAAVRRGAARIASAAPRRRPRGTTGRSRAREQVPDPAVGVVQHRPARGEAVEQLVRRARRQHRNGLTGTA